MADPNVPTRNQIAKIAGNDPEMIKALERLFIVAGELTPADIARLTQLILDNTYALGAADNKAEMALSGATAAERLADLLARAPIAETHNSVRTDYVDLNINSPLPADAPGRFYWNRDDGTMDVDLYGGSVLQVGQETHFYAKNTSGSLISNGTPVMFTGTVGASGKLTFGLAVADGSVPADYMMGVATQDIADNDFGYVTSFGLVRGFDTTGTPYAETWADGDLLYFDPATPGTWTNVEPSAPSIGVPVAVVINTGAGGSGSIFVRMKVSESLNNLQDVYINGTGTPLAGEVLIYDATQARWENHHITPGSNITITNADGAITIAVSGLGTMAAQNANAVAITGGTIDGTIIGGTTPAAITGTSGSFSGNLAVDANTLFVDATNNRVGFGTASPSSLLTLATANPEIRFADTDATGFVQVRQSGAAFLVTVDATNVDAGSSLQVAIDGTERMRIIDTGNVGIGNTAPVTPLHVTGATMTTGVIYRNQPAQTTKAAAATLTIAELLTGIIQYTGAAANLTLPTGTLIEGGLPATFPTNMSFDFSVINTGTGTATLVTAAGLTLVGSMAVATGTTSMFRVRKTALNTYTVYRIG